MTTFDALADEGFISLTTFRKSGKPVPTTVWVGRDGDALLVTTPRGSGKVKRLRRDPRVEMSPSSRFGNVDDDAPTVAGVGEILDDDAARERCNDVMVEKYGLEYRVMMGIEKLGRKGDDNRVIVRITRE
ncbi:PPOX class F420-dependent oxidoreductase [uncultured Cellulomonas sp.]|uniref:PPOX class F420-dependent oxidoreductase n=1 Tax=uncultured Cellulomonas sp. TaxID=189682 RepID=UPI0028EAD5E5|nr:PPOX class F420-dependent oxidoreductase [uncultured Cellulomonas sp.]